MRSCRQATAPRLASSAGIEDELRAAEQSDRAAGPLVSHFCVPDLGAPSAVDEVGLPGDGALPGGPDQVRLQLGRGPTLGALGEAAEGPCPAEAVGEADDCSAVEESVPREVLGAKFDPAGDPAGLRLQVVDAEKSRKGPFHVVGDLRSQATRFLAVGHGEHHTGHFMSSRAREDGPYNARMFRTIDLRNGGDPPDALRAVLEDGVLEDARAICDRVREEGDAALIDLTRRLDGAAIEGRIRVSDEEIAAASDRVDPALKEALDAVAERLRDLHVRQLPRSWEEEKDGVVFGEVVLPLASAGCYVPGGRSAYPSSVLMTVIPAKVAGVDRVAVCSPPAADGSVPDEVLFAASIAGARDVFRVGGAQAIAALAYGTETIAAVDKVVGPGNVWVTAAKREVAGVVGVDAFAGPTELVVVADDTADPKLVACDLVAQAEHDPQARAFLVSLDPALPELVMTRLVAEIEASPRRDIVGQALDRSAAILVPDEAAAARVVDELAPEHLQILTSDPRRFLDQVRAYGAAFLGPFTPVAFGDYGVGSNHVLPTMGTARFASGLRAADFVTVASLIEANGEAINRFGPEIERLSAAEGLPGHARTSEVRRT